MVESSTVSTMETSNHDLEEFEGHDLVPDTTELITLEEPDVDKMRKERNDRTRSAMEVRHFSESTHRIKGIPITSVPQQHLSLKYFPEKDQYLWISQ
jgi:hypothetical protein